MIEYSPFSDQVMRNPHDVYRQLRREAPVYYLEDYDAWAFSRFEDIWVASTDAASYTTTRGITGDQLLARSMPAPPMFSSMDPPRHTLVRSSIRSFFSPGRMKALEPSIRGFVTEIFDSLEDRSEWDAVRDFGEILAAQVGCLVAGFPAEDVDLLTGLIRRFFSRDPEINGITPDGLAALGEMGAYFIDLTRARRARPGDPIDPLGALLGVEADGSPLPDDEIASHMSLLLLGSFETFPKVLAAALHRLAEHPEQRALLVADPALIPDAFNETLRYDMPTQFLGRTVLQTVSVRGQTLTPGQSVIFLYPSANRDEDEFDDPDRFDILRRPKRILSFGHGIHACLGLHAARMEGRIALEELLARFPDYAIDPERTERYVTDFVQGFDKLGLSLQAS